MLVAVKHWSGGVLGLPTCPFPSLPIAEALAAAPPPRLSPGAAPQLAQGSDGGALVVCLHVVEVGMVRQLPRLSQQPLPPSRFDSRFGGKAAGHLANAVPRLGWLPATLATEARGSRLAFFCERRCDARVRPQQRGCGGLSIPLRIAQRSHATLQQRRGAWGRQTGRPLSRLCAPLTLVL